MQAILYSNFRESPTLQTVRDPTPPPAGVVLRVTATGVCRSDWHGWMGHDSDIHPPHVPGHELAGVVVAVGREVKNWRGGERVTLPFVCGCGDCPQCASGNQQVCDRQFQPGFTHWGSFAEFVAIDYADTNLVLLPDEIDDVTAAVLGCRFVTSFRAVVDQGRAKEGEWVAVHGCGGVGLSAIMIASALGARVVAIDIDDNKLRFAQKMGATVVMNGRSNPDVAGAVHDCTDGGAHVSVDALGHPATCWNSVACLRKRGRHVQIGLLLADQARPALPMDRVVARELEIYGSHGIQAHRYPAIFALIAAGKLQPQKLIGRRITLAEAPAALTQMDAFPDTGVTVIDRLPPVSSQMHTLYNVLEFGFWLILAAALTWRAYFTQDRGRRTDFLIAATAFSAFGVSDLVELETGTWYRPWWLFHWKVACVGVLIVCYIRDRRQRANAAPDHDSH